MDTPPPSVLLSSFHHLFAELTQPGSTPTRVAHFFGSRRAPILCDGLSESRRSKIRGLYLLRRKPINGSADSNKIKEGSGT
jgi:hypothetical protein